MGNADSAFDTSIKDVESRLDQSYNKKKKQLNRETREKSIPLSKVLNSLNMLEVVL